MKQWPQRMSEESGSTVSLESESHGTSDTSFQEYLENIQSMLKAKINGLMATMDSL